MLKKSFILSPYCLWYKVHTVVILCFDTLLVFFVFSDDYLILPSGNLQIISVSAQHQGTYKCGAFNPVTGATVMQAHGTKLSVKRKSDNIGFKFRVFHISVIFYLYVIIC